MASPTYFMTANGQVMIPVPKGYSLPPSRPRRRHRTGGEISARKRQVVLARDGHRCRSCGATHDLCMDHVVPVSRGGKHDLENLQTLCRSCNSWKGARR